MSKWDTKEQAAEIGQLKKRIEQLEQKLNNLMEQYLWDNRDRYD